MIRKLYILFVFFIISFTLEAQISITAASDQTAESGSSGIFYTLPQTYLKIDITVLKTEKIPGPYHMYASKYLGLEDVISYRSENYKITNVSVSSFIRPDPKHYYFVEYGDKTSKDEVSLTVALSEAGLITGVNKLPKKETVINKLIKVNQITDKKSYTLFRYQAENNLFKKIDTVVRKYIIDTLTIEKEFYRSSWVQKTTEQKAKDAADFINRIRENRFLLISGYQEVNYGESMKYMDKQLAKLEDEYLSLFTGVTLKSTENYSYVFLPDETTVDIKNTLLKLSEDRGVFDATASIGDDVYLEITPNGLAENLSKFIDSKQDKKYGENHFYYRIPEFAGIQIKCKDKIMYEADIMINQLGLVAYGPLFNTLIEFYSETGSIKDIKILIKE